MTRWYRHALLSSMLVAGAAGCSQCQSPPPAATATVALAEIIRGSMGVTQEGAQELVVRPERIPLGATVTTEPHSRGSLSLDQGAWLLLDHQTAIQMGEDQVHLNRGRLWVDASFAEETAVATPHGRVSGTASTWSLAVTDNETTLHCGSGEVTYHSPRGEGRLSQGESLRLTPDGAPQVSPTELWHDWTGGLAAPTPGGAPRAAGVGVLAGRRLEDVGQARTPLPVRGHEVQARLQGDLAQTEVTQTFFNARSDQLEAEYTIRLPESALVSEFAVDLGDGFRTGAVNAWQSDGGYRPAWVSAETPSSALSFDGPHRLRARLYPIAPGATVRVRLTYSEWLPRSGPRRTYVYPMHEHGSGSPPLLGEFILRVDTSAAGPSLVRAGMGAEIQGESVVLRRSDFRPRADFWLELLDDDGGAAHPSDLALAYVVEPPGDASGTAPEGPEQYVLVDLPFPEPPSSASESVPLELVILVDRSGGTPPEELDLARSVVEAVLQQLTPTDRVALLLGDVTAQAAGPHTGELQPVTPDSREALLQALTNVELGGATDLGRSLREAAQLAAGRPRGALLYLGDGHPTTGDLDVAAIRENLARVSHPPRFFAMGIGEEAHLGLLRALFGSQAWHITERSTAAKSVMRLLAEAARPTVRNVTVDLGATVERVFPRPPLSLPAGENVRLVGRLRGPLPPSLTVTGLLDGQPLQRTLRLERQEVDDAGDIRRRWGSDRLAELLANDAGREDLVELGLRFGLVSPWTSLVIGAPPGGTWSPVAGFDHAPESFVSRVASDTLRLFDAAPLGWRRRASSPQESPPSAPESTWSSRTAIASAEGSSAPEAGEESLARAAVVQALRQGQRGPRGCFERRLLVRPEISGEVTVSVQLAGQGQAPRVTVTHSSVGDTQVESCITTEIQGIRFPNVEVGRPVTVTHSYHFTLSFSGFGVRSQCSAAAAEPLTVRRALWGERLSVDPSVQRALEVWQQASEQCELPDWRASRALLDLMRTRVGSVARQLELYRGLDPETPAAAYLQYQLLRQVRTPEELALVRSGLGLEIPVNWSAFARRWQAAADAPSRLELVRRWLAVLPSDFDLRLRLLSLLEATGAVAEARRVARELRADPLADAQVRAAVGEFWLRQEEENEARRAFSELVEYAPLDPWARQRLGDLYRAHGWYDDAYREYQTLARLQPANPAVLLLLARAAAGAGRIDEALRYEQELSESVAPGTDQGVAAWARLWTSVRLAQLKAAADDEPQRLAVVERERTSGALRQPPALFVALTWDHPDDAPELWVRPPTAQQEGDWLQAPLGGGAYGIQALRLSEREPGSYDFEIRGPRPETRPEGSAQLLVVSLPGTAEEQLRQVQLRLNPDQQRVAFRLTESGELEPVASPPSG